MSSILTNNGAMVALQTMKSINKNMGQVQAEISTGKAVGSAKDNAAVWAISKTMESDVSGFKAISDSLSLGSSTIAVARSASEQITNLLKEVKGKVVNSQEENVDRTKIQADIGALRDQISSIVGAAQFNGLNLLSNKSKTAGSGTVNVLSSLDRASDGSVSASNISVGKADLSTTTSVVGGTALAAGAALTAKATGAATTAATALTGAATAPTTAVTIVTGSVAAGDGYNITLTAGAAGLSTANTANIQEIRYVARDGDTAADVAKGLASAFNDYAKSKGLETQMSAAVGSGATANQLTLTGSTTVGNNVTAQLNVYAPAGNTIGGGLEKLSSIDVSSSEGAASALGVIEGLTQTAIQAASDFGTAQKRIEIQNTFVGNLVDSLRSGIGSMVDANMEEASARLQALQVQQQLATQSLSIANQAPQSILALFR
ncbi:flagellin [Pseudotabrizicola alkalilacus]|uniref:Flagellin n=1 Tax=Pseudotabrizicola alkalilacus TaxID=2305252 RepID=A0A411YYC9_9RHOB|nr:flagellin [Pseudotabrizicola alkalilacus]RGP35802.1 flagellin [Pseudotabrizicola alkalilacus]